MREERHGIDCGHGILAEWGTENRGEHPVTTFNIEVRNQKTVRRTVYMVFAHIYPDPRQYSITV